MYLALEEQVNLALLQAQTLQSSEGPRTAWLAYCKVTDAALTVFPLNYFARAAYAPTRSES